MNNFEIERVMSTLTIALKSYGPVLSFCGTSGSTDTVTSGRNCHEIFRINFVFRSTPPHYLCCRLFQLQSLCLVRFDNVDYSFELSPRIDSNA